MPGPSDPPLLVDLVRAAGGGSISAFLEVALSSELPLEGLHHPVLVHPEVLEHLDHFGQPALHQRCALALRHLAAYGRTTVFKGTRGANQGWRRSPLGGGGGSHFYLWWQPGPGEPGGPPAILVRTVRHHDETSVPLSADARSAYTVRPFVRDEVDEVLPAPWTDEQQAFLAERGRVRVLRGAPGSGKTTALWEAIRRSGAAHPLYVTWSRRLAGLADRWFAHPSFRPLGEVPCWDVATFTGDLLRADVVRLAHRTALDRFRRDVDALRLGRGALGPWFAAREALFDELRASVLGRPDVVSEGDRLRLDLDAWSADALGRGLGPAAVDGARRVVERLGLQRADVAGRYCPDLVAAARARARLADGARLARPVDALFVDEVQDLTGLELALVCDVVAAAPERPELLLAGDEGQTVRSTAFDWGSLGRLLSDRLEAPTRTQLHGNLRSPAAIAAVLERAGRFYKDLDRRLRPRGGSDATSTYVAAARVVLATTTSPGEATEVLAELAAEPGVALVSTGEHRPEWLPPGLADEVLTPADAKGLEYASVVVLGLADTLRALDDGRAADALDAAARRTAVDRLRVALSRATSNLSALEVGLDDADLQRTRELLEPVEIGVPELPRLAVDDDRTLVEQVDALLTEARQLLDERPARAWGRLEVIARLVQRHAEEADDALRAALDDARLELGWRLLLHPDAGPVRAAAAAAVAAGCAAVPAMAVGAAALTRPIGAWDDADRAKWLLALAAIPRRQRPTWLGESLRPHRQALLAALRAPAALAPAALAEAGRGTLAAALRLLEAPPDGAHDALLLDAADRALAAGDATTEAALLEELHEPRPERLAAAFERAGLPASAVDALARAGRTDEAVAAARRLDLPDVARRLARGTAADRLLRDLHATEGRLRSWSAEGTLLPAERARLATAVAGDAARASDDRARLAQAEASLAALRARLEDAEARLQQELAEAARERAEAARERAEAAAQAEEAARAAADARAELARVEALRSELVASAETKLATVADTVTGATAPGVAVRPAVAPAPPSAAAPPAASRPPPARRAPVPPHVALAGRSREMFEALLASAAGEEGSVEDHDRCTAALVRILEGRACTLAQLAADVGRPLGDLERAAALGIGRRPPPDLRLSKDEVRRITAALAHRDPRTGTWPSGLRCPYEVDRQAAVELLSMPFGEPIGAVPDGVWTLVGLADHLGLRLELVRDAASGTAGEVASDDHPTSRRYLDLVAKTVERQQAALRKLAQARSVASLRDVARATGLRRATLERAATEMLGKAPRFESTLKPAVLQKLAQVLLRPPEVEGSAVDPPAGAAPAPDATLPAPDVPQPGWLGAVRRPETIDAAARLVGRFVIIVEGRDDTLPNLARWLAVPLVDVEEAARRALGHVPPRDVVVTAEDMRRLGTVLFGRAEDGAWPVPPPDPEVARRHAIAQLERFFGKGTGLLPSTVWTLAALAEHLRRPVAHVRDAAVRVVPPDHERGDVPLRRDLLEAVAKAVEKQVAALRKVARSRSPTSLRDVAQVTSLRRATLEAAAVQVLGTAPRFEGPLKPATLHQLVEVLLRPPDEEAVATAGSVAGDVEGGPEPAVEPAPTAAPETPTVDDPAPVKELDREEVRRRHRAVVVLAAEGRARTLAELGRWLSVARPVLEDAARLALGRVPPQDERLTLPDSRRIGSALLRRGEDGSFPLEPLGDPAALRREAGERFEAELHQGLARGRTLSPTVCTLRGLARHLLRPEGQVEDAYRAIVGPGRIEGDVDRDEARTVAILEATAEIVRVGHLERLERLVQTTEPLSLSELGKGNVFRRGTLHDAALEAFGKVPRFEAALAPERVREIAAVLLRPAAVEEAPEVVIPIAVPVLPRELGVLVGPDGQTSTPPRRTPEEIKNQLITTWVLAVEGRPVSIEVVAAWTELPAAVIDAAARYALGRVPPREEELPSDEVRRVAVGLMRMTTDQTFPDDPIRELDSYCEFAAQILDKTSRHGFTGARTVPLTVCSLYGLVPHLGRPHDHVVDAAYATIPGDVVHRFPWDVEHLELVAKAVQRQVAALRKLTQTRSPASLRDVAGATLLRRATLEAVTMAMFGKAPRFESSLKPAMVQRIAQELLEPSATLERTGVDGGGDGQGA